MKKLVGLALLVAFASACEPLEAAFVQDMPDDPACQGTVGLLSGTWEIEGSGERFDCDDSTFDASLFDLTSIPLEVVQTGAVLELSLDDPPPAFTFFDGEVSGRCFEFRTSEDTPLGIIDYDWSGVVAAEDPPVLTGQFSGTGPGTCETRGSFQVTVSP